MTDSARPLRLLYVEDDRISALLMSAALRNEPRVLLEVVEDVPEALASATASPPDLLVLDAHLPGGTGLQLLALLRQLPGLQQVPAYMCSANSASDDIRAALAAGFTGYWTKPAAAAQVLGDLARWLPPATQASSSPPDSPAPPAAP